MCVCALQELQGCSGSQQVKKETPGVCGTHTTPGGEKEKKKIYSCLGL